MSDYIVIDLETKGFGENGEAPELVVFSYANDNLEGVSDDKEYLGSLCGDYRPIFHNAAFDLDVIRKYGISIPFGGFEDTLLLANTLNSVRNVGLKDLCIEYKLPIKKKDFPMKQWVKDGFPDTPELRDYCLFDAKSAWLLWTRLLELAENKEFKLYRNTEIPVCEAVIQMQNVGWFINEEKALELYDTLTANITEATNKILGTYPLYPIERQYKTNHDDLELLRRERSEESRSGFIYTYRDYEPFNPNSNDHKAWALQQEGWQPRKLTANGKPKVDKFELSHASIKYPVAKEFLKVAKATKLKSSFVEVLIEKRDSKGILRGRFNQGGTVTGRFSSSDPNLQNIPASGEMGKKIRDCFSAPPGYQLVGGDLSNIEARILAHYLEIVCKDSVLANAFRDGLDMHWENAKAWGLAHNPSLEDGKEDPGRRIAKTVLYLAMYGGSHVALAQQLDCSEEEAADIFRIFEQNAKSIQTLKELVWYTMRKRGYIMTLFGRKLYYPDINSKAKWKRSRAERQVFNALIQGSAADILKDLMAKSWTLLKIYPSSRWVAQVHDECIFEVDEAKANDFAKQMTELWQKQDYLAVPTPTDFSTGLTWSEIK